jgi:hypothetical protein
VTSTVSLSPAAAKGVGSALDQDVYEVESAERMAWLAVLLRKCEDRSDWFPRGKWATIQHIEGQVDQAADEYLEIELMRDPPEANPGTVS